MNDKTLYRYVAGGLLKAKNGDMPRVCRLKPRAGKPIEHKVDTEKGVSVGIDKRFVNLDFYFRLTPHANVLFSTPKKM